MAGWYDDMMPFGPRSAFAGIVASAYTAALRAPAVSVEQSVHLREVADVWWDWALEQMGLAPSLGQHERRTCPDPLCDGVWRRMSEFTQTWECVQPHRPGCPEIPPD